MTGVQLFSVLSKFLTRRRSQEVASPGVPPFNEYYPSRESMSPAQRDFYDRLALAWRHGEALDVDGNVSYVFCLAYEILRQPNKEVAADGLLAVAKAYRHEDKINDYCRTWAADCFVAAGKYVEAIELRSPITLNRRATTATDHLLSLKASSGMPLSGADVLTLFGPKVTGHGKRSLDQLVEYIDLHLAAIQERSGDLLQAWIRDAATRRTPMALFNGVPGCGTTAPILNYHFSFNPNVEATCAELTREAENALRENQGLPRVGEGWIEETRLYYALREAFTGIVVIHHAQPDWLGRQHLDIFLPSLSVAVEYQGPQHDGPVHFFGGHGGFAKAQERDERKRRLCSANGVRLIEVKPGYLLADVIAEVRGPTTPSCAHNASVRT